MKRVFLIVVVIFVTFLTSCVDSTNELEERIEYEKSIEVFSVDREDIDRPGDQGGD